MRKTINSLLYSLFPIVSAFTGTKTTTTTPKSYKDNGAYFPNVSERDSWNHGGSSDSADLSRRIAGYSVEAVEELRRSILKAREGHKITEAPVLSLSPDRNKTGRELASDLRDRLAEIGLKPEDVLVRFVRGQGWVHTPTAYTIGENAILAQAIGVRESNATWADQFYKSSCIEIGTDHRNSEDIAYIVYRAADLIRIDCVGDRYVDRPFYAFKGSPHAAIVAKIHDAGDHPMDRPLALPQTPSNGTSRVYPFNQNPKLEQK